MATTVQEVTDYILNTPFNTNKAILNAMLVDLAENGDGGDGVVQLRRDNDYNYAADFVPANGELCLVDTARNGLRIKCGDGKTQWSELGYVDEYVVKGYFKEGKFYKDLACTQLVDGADHKIFIDISDRKIYFYNENEFISASGEVYGAATDTTPGIMKLYQTVGQNTDGTMSQKAIADELDDKIEMALNKEEELLIFFQD